MDLPDSLETCSVCLILCYKYGSHNNILNFFFNFQVVNTLIEYLVTEFQYLLRLRASMIEFVVGTFLGGDGGSTVVKVLCYKSEVRWFDPSWS